MSSPLVAKTQQLYEEYGQRKPMGQPAAHTRRPHYFLLRTFLGENDLLIILNTKRCKYRCHFCQLPEKSSSEFIPADDIVAQFDYVLEEVKHSLSILDRVTLTNEGSILDTETFPASALFTITECVAQLRRVRRLTLETRLEFVDPTVISQLEAASGRARVTLLTGLETLDPYIRDHILFKREPLSVFEAGLDTVAQAGAELAAYVLFKPNPNMTDEDAYDEAERSIDYLVEQCRSRNIPLDCIRLNPFYMAVGSRWERLAPSTPGYKPPRLTDVIRLAAKKAQGGLRVYIGLSTEGLGKPNGSYMAREDYSSGLIRHIKLFNDRKVSSFEGVI